MRAWPQAILFDLYETLISEFDPAWTPQPSLAAPRLGVEEAAFAAAWRQVSAQRMTGTLPDFPAALHAICQRLGVTPDAAVIAHLHQERLAAKARPFTRIAAPIVGLIQRLHAMAIKLGVLSNAAPEEVAAWKTCVLAPFFDTVVFSYQVGRMKPDPQVYWLACERLGTTAADTLFVGDGGRDELVGAVQAGLTAYWAQWYVVPWPAAKRPTAWRERAARFPALATPEDLLHRLNAAPAP
jgi:HAD superfamily hydrolase (TIGR01509 family)